jgi:predicted MFS family arabinose efflux permease
VSVTDSDFIAKMHRILTLKRPWNQPQGVRERHREGNAPGRRPRPVRGVHRSPLGGGRRGDRHGTDRLILHSLPASAARIALTALTHSPVVVIAGVTLFGIGFGITQNATLTLMYARAPTSAYAAVSALWNFAYDGGMGLGALGFGVLAAATGYPVAFALTAALMLTALAPAWRDQRTSRGAGS